MPLKFSVGITIAYLLTDTAELKVRGSIKKPNKLMKITKEMKDLVMKNLNSLEIDS